MQTIPQPLANQTHFSFLPRQSLNTVPYNRSPPSSTHGIHPKIIQLLSSFSGYYGALWPDIIREAGWLERFLTLRFVNHFFRDICNELQGHRRSERAKR